MFLPIYIYSSSRGCEITGRPNFPLMHPRRRSNLRKQAHTQTPHLLNHHLLSLSHLPVLLSLIPDLISVILFSKVSAFNPTKLTNTKPSRRKRTETETEHQIVPLEGIFIRVSHFSQNLFLVSFPRQIKSLLPRSRHALGHHHPQQH